MTAFYLLAEQDPVDQWLGEHPEVLGGLILTAAVVNLLFALAMLLGAFLLIRKFRNLPPIVQIVLYAPGATFCVIVLVMILWAVYLFCGGSPNFQ